MSSILLFDLGEKPDPDLNARLLALLRAQAQSPVQLSALGRRRLDVPLVEILIAAQQEWRKQGIDFALHDVSAELESGLSLLGITRDLLTIIPAPPMLEQGAVSA